MDGSASTRTLGMSTSAAPFPIPHGFLVDKLDQLAGEGTRCAYLYTGRDACGTVAARPTANLTLGYQCDLGFGWQGERAVQRGSGAAAAATGCAP